MSDCLCRWFNYSHHANLVHRLNDKMYDYCTRELFTTYALGATSLAERSGSFWCSTVNHVDENLDHGNTDNFKGYCGEDLFPPDNGCQETYEPVSIRRSSPT
jgi:hypothetical protein